MLSSMIIAFSLYSGIPMPKIAWKEKNRKYSLCFFPLVGVVIGLLEWGAFLAMEKAGFGALFRGVILTVLPLVITGGIHMDGFLDTVDAKRSYREKEEKLKILKDPHIGAFAAIFGLVYLLLFVGLFSETTEEEIVIVLFCFVLSRILSGISVTCFRKAKTDGMAAEAASVSGGAVKWILIFEGLACAGMMCFLHPVLGSTAVLAGLLTFGYYRWMSYREFGGVTGDLAGYFLQLCELVMLFCVTICSKFF